MPIGANTYYSDPQIGQIVSNLGTAIYGDPETRMKGAYYSAESNRANAEATKAGAETTGITQKNAAIAKLGTLGQMFMPMPGEDPEAYKARASQALGIIAQAGGGNADDLAKSVSTGLGSIYAQGNDNDKTTSLVIGGHPLTKDAAVSPAMANANASRDATYQQNRELAVQGSRNAGEEAVAGINNNGALARIFAAPVDAKAGTTTYLSGNDPRRSVMGNNGVIEGAPTTETVRGQAGSQILALPTDQAPSSNLANVFSGGAGYKGTVAKPKSVTGKNINDAIMAGASMVPGAVDKSVPTKPVLDANFEAQFPPEKVTAARNAAGAVLAQTGDAQKAGSAYIQALGIQPGSTFSTPHGVFTSPFLGKGGIQAPVAAAAPAPAQQPAAMPAPPADPKMRQPNAIYQTPKGPLQWTGTGWISPAAQQPGA